MMHKYFKKDLRQEGSWEEFGIAKIVRHWFKKPEKNFGLVVEVFSGDSAQNLAVMPRSTDFDKNVSTKHKYYHVHFFESNASFEP